MFVMQVKVGTVFASPVIERPKIRNSEDVEEEEEGNLLRDFVTGLNMKTLKSMTYACLDVFRG